MLASPGVMNFRVNCGYSIRGDLHCGQRMAEPISGSLASHSSINWFAFSKSSSCTRTFAFACGLDMNAICWRWPSLCTSALMPDPCSRAFRCLALAGSLNVAIVTMRIRSGNLHQTSTTGRAQDGRGGALRCPAVAAARRPCLYLRQRRRWKPFVEHQVNEHAGDRNVKPDRHRPARDPSVPVPAPPEHRHERDDHERQRDEREQDVRDQHREIK